MAPLTLSVLGPPRLECDGRPVELTLRRSLAVVIYLAITRRPQTRELLAGLLWPDADNREARGRLRRALHRITEALGPGLVHADGGSLSISAADIRVDARDFEEHATAGLRVGGETPPPEQTEHLRQAAALYADDFLAGFSLPDSSAWDEWQFLERERLRETFARVLDRLIETYRAAGALEDAIEHARRRLALDPLHEPGHRSLMELYALAGQQAGALRQYGECRRLLGDELGIEPEPATVELYEVIRARRLRPIPGGPAAGEPEPGMTNGSHGQVGAGPSGLADWDGGAGRPMVTVRPGNDVPALDPPGPELLERAPQLAHLGALLKDAAAGRGMLMLLGGEAGVGKTALVRRFGRMAGRDFRVLEGACDALSTPRALGPLADIAAVVGGEVERLLAEGGRRDAIFAAFLAELSRGPEATLVIFEDVHWADEATLDLLRFLGRRLSSTRTLLIATYRDDEVGPSHPLRIVMGDLTASALTRLSLAPLSSDAVATLAAGSHVDLVALHRQTGGNPLFVTEVLSSGSDGIPPSVRDAVLARVARLSPDGRAVLQQAAVIDARVEAALLADVHGPGFEAVEECLALGVLVADGDALAFRHELSRQAVLQAMSPSRRLVIHRRVLQVLRSRPRGENDLAMLAHHADLAADPEAVLIFAPQAAERAAGLGAHREAAAQYTRALRFADRLMPEQRADLYDRRSYECLLIGQLADAIEARKAAVRIWRFLENRLKEGESLAWLSRLHWLSGHRTEADEADRLALSILETLPPGPQLAWAYSNRALLHLLANEHHSAIDRGGRAAALAEEFDRQEVRLHALTTVAVARVMLDDETGWADLERCVREAQAAGLDEDVGRAFANLCSAAVFCWRFGLAERYLDEGIAYCLDHDLDSHRLYLLGSRALLLQCRAHGRGRAMPRTPCWPSPTPTPSRASMRSWRSAACGPGAAKLPRLIVSWTRPCAWRWRWARSCGSGRSGPPAPRRPGYAVTSNRRATRPGPASSLRSTNATRRSPASWRSGCGGPAD